MTPLNIRKIDPATPDQNLIVMAAKILTNGGLVVTPTETKYGILAWAEDLKAVKKIFELKKRSLDKATAVFAGSREEISRLGVENRISKKLAAAFLPGPLTLVLRNKSGYGPPISVNNKIGIRLSSSPVISLLAGSVRGNLTATSANISGGKEASTIDDISQVFGEAIDLYLDGGRLESPGSTVVDCSGEDYRILRSGVIADNDIAKSLNKV